ncbi:MAG: type IV secretion system DNA-binding domain-containing protein, partial [Gemmatimonadetes bacterium]|nr:type IV secretion system DNA-binding domain-containing protein [Gemmatimonadota bacterium]
DTAQWAADSRGRSEVEEVAEGFSYGANTIRDGVSLTPRRELRALALPSEIMRLKNLSGYLKFPGPFPVASIRLKHVKRPAAAARFVPRKGEGVEADDRADGAAPAARADADNAAETGARAAPDPGKRGKAPRDKGGVARDMPPEPAALQEVLALPPPEEPQADAAAQAVEGSGKKGGRKAQRAETKAGRKARRSGSCATDGPDATGEASPGESASGAAAPATDGSHDGTWY